MSENKKRTVPVGSGGESYTALDQLNDVWAPFMVPDKPRVRVARTSNETNHFTKWCIDTGANVVVTSPEDTAAIVSILSGEDLLDTTGGTVSAKRALLQTPAGLCEGLVSPSAQRNTT